MLDITEYTDQELSLHVLNAEDLYHEFLACDDERDLRALADRHFVYTPEQFAELLEDFHAGQ